MAKAQRFEDLIAWQKARLLTREIYQATQRASFAKDYGLSGQIQRAAVSIMSNIAEGFERGNPGDYQRFLSMQRHLVEKSAHNFTLHWTLAMLLRRSLIIYVI